MAGVQANTARLIALFISCVLYGILLTTFVPCIRSLLLSPTEKFQLKPNHKIKYPILVASVLMFLVSSFGVVLSLQDVIDGFINYDGPGGALEFFTTVNGGWKHWIVIIEDSVQAMLGDALLIYRCYVLYDRSWRVIAIPVVNWLASCALAIVCSYREATMPEEDRLNSSAILPFLSAVALLTFTTSIVTTYLIIRRLLTIERTKDLRGPLEPHLLSRVATIFFETGLIYTLSLVASLGVYLSDSELEFVASLAMIHIIPITCNLLLIRVEGIRHPKFTGSAGSVGTSDERKFNPNAENEV
ncbi:hypothetical protein DFH07DRAFT_849318 [Mycena maculata]|uniref:Uncharacterized protein n=1 Tax=Mycena maculata TaxID=230809 RepID=A0AAD7HY93_9AGAR|nr:hypothetical protein DFH07DRAFT_849318 [Mycena maculata]